MASPNYTWQWSEEHKRWYRQEYINGKWETIYAHHRSDSLFSNHSGYGPAAPSNPISHLAVPPPRSVEVSPVPQVHHPPTPQLAYPPTPQLAYPPLQVHQQAYPPSTFHHPPANPPWGTYSYPNPQLSSPYPTVPASSQLQVPSSNPLSGRRRGLTLEGRYVPGAQHFEDLDSSFYVRGKDFFKEGKVFAVLFTEPCGSTVTDYNTSISTVRFGQYVHSQIRRFIVVRTMREFCYACPIFTYKGQGTLKQGVRPEEHAIAYSWSREPELLEGEPELRLKPICIVGATGTYPLQKASRIYFGIHHPIQYNVKVKNLGDVYPPQIKTLRGYWKMVNREPTNQAIEVTAAGPAENDDDDEDDDDDDNHAVEDEEDYAGTPHA